MASTAKMNFAGKNPFNYWNQGKMAGDKRGQSVSFSQQLWQFCNVLCPTGMPVTLS